MSSDEEAAVPLVRGPSVYVARDFSGQPASPTNNGTRRHRFQRHDGQQASYGSTTIDYHDDHVEFDVEDGVPMTPTTAGNNAAHFPFPGEEDLAEPLLGATHMYNSSAFGGTINQRNTSLHEPVLPVSEEATAPVVTPVLPLPSTTSRSIRKGLGMRDIVSDTSHLWLMHQVSGKPVRVRMFPQGAIELIQYAQNVSLNVPRYDEAAGRRAKLRQSTKSTTHADRDSHSSRHSSRLSLDGSTVSSVTSKSSDRITETCWIDLQTTSKHEIELLLDMFHLSPATIECVLDQHSIDHVEHFPSHGYVFLNIACQGMQANTSIIGCNPKIPVPVGQRSRSSSVASTASNTHSGARHIAGMIEETPQVIVSCIVFPDWIITIHQEPFQELGDLVKQVHLDFTLKKKTGKLRRHGSSQQAVDATLNNNPSSTTASAPTAAPGGSDAAAFPPEKRPSSGAQGGAVMRRMMRPAWILCTLVDFVVSNFLPDPTPLLSVVDDVEARVMLLANVSNQHQQRDLSQRIVWLRRVITTHRRVVNSKEQLLAQLLLPVMRTNFIARRSVNADVYVYCQKQIAKVAERIDSARDMLQSASSNFAAAGQLRVARSSQALEHRMHLMSNVTAVLLPPALIAGIWGMNVTVPFSAATGHDQIRAFWVLMGLIALWLVLTVKRLFNIFLDVRATSASAHESWDPDVLFGAANNTSFTQPKSTQRPKKPKVKEFSAWCCTVESH